MAAEDERQGGYLQRAGASVRAGYNAVMRGGEIQAAFRQGFNELGAALKAFPDSIQVDEPGAVFNPLYRDIPSESLSGHPSPGDIAGGNATGPVQGETLQANRQDVPSPGQIADGQGQQPMQGHGHDHGRGGVYGPEHGVYGPERGVYGPEHGVYGPEHGVYGRDNGGQGPPADAAKPGPLPSPGAIAEGQEKSWRQRIEEQGKGNQDGNAGNDQNEQARGRSLPDEQRDQGRGGRGR